MSIPNDPVILLGYINTQLRVNYQNLEDLCKSLSISKADLEMKLSSIGYAYNEKLNRFK